MTGILSLKENPGSSARMAHVRAEEPGLGFVMRSNMLAIQIFIYLQVLDFITTMIGFKVGANEASPFIVKLIYYTSPAMGVAASKLVALAIGGLCIAAHRARLVTWINYWYAGLVVWNLSMIMTAIGNITASGASALPHIH